MGRVGNDRSIADFISGCIKVINLGQILAERLSTLHIATAMANLLVDQGHGSQLATISLIAAKDVHL